MPSSGERDERGLGHVVKRSIVMGRRHEAEISRSPWLHGMWVREEQPIRDLLI